MFKKLQTILPKYALFIFISALILVLIDGIVGYLLLRNAAEVNQDQTTLLLEAREVKASGITQEERTAVEEFIREFVDKRKDCESDEILNKFTLPITQEEEKELDYIDGDKTSVEDGGFPSPLCGATHLFNYSLERYFIREIDKTEDRVRVVTDELRIGVKDSKPGGDLVKIEGLIYELKKVNDNYKIESYHKAESPSKDISLKYEGLYP